MTAARPLARLVAPGFDPEQVERLAFFMRIVLPAQIFFLCGACFTALLFVRRQFRVPALAPLIYNLCIISGGLLAPQLARLDLLRALFSPAALAQLGGMTGFCAGATLGAFIGAFLLPLRVAREDGLHLHMRWRHPLLGRFLLTALPLMLGQTVIMLDEQFLRVFGSLAGDGVVSLLSYARRISQVPVGLMGQTAAVASYPFLVNLLAAGDVAGFDNTLRKALRAGLMLIIPCALCIAALAWPVLTVIFQGGRFGPEETLAALPLTRLMLTATPFWLIYAILVRGYYAQGDTLTPAVSGTAMTLLCLPLYRYWAVPHGGLGIAALSCISVSLYVLLLMGIWTRRKGRNAFSGLLGLTLRMLACSLPAAGAAWFCADAVQNRVPLHPFLAACAALAAGGLAFALVFLPLAWRAAPGAVENIRARLRRRSQG